MFRPNAGSDSVCKALKLPSIESSYHKEESTSARSTTIDAEAAVRFHLPGHFSADFMPNRQAHIADMVANF
jgi:hypothetical protein